MLGKVKEKNQEILKQHFEEAFGEGYIVDVIWGYPVNRVSVKFEKDNEKTIWNLVFNFENDQYDLSTYSSKLVDGVEVPTEATISKQIIDFIIKRTKEISELFFTTREAPQQEAGSAEVLDKEEETKEEAQESAIEESKQE